MKKLSVFGRTVLLLLALSGLVAAPVAAQGPFVPGRAYTASDFKGTYFEMPHVYQPTDALAPTGLNVGWTNGSVFVGGAKVAVGAGTVAVTLNKASCQAPAYSGCNFIYANSSGTVAATVTIGTASASGNSILALVTTSASAVLAVNYPYEDSSFSSVLYPFTSPVVSNPMTTAGE